jgi:TPR repeat protein
VPGYLSRVLDRDGEPAGTCFQVAPYVLVTAWHVLDQIGATDPGASLRMDPLGGGVAFTGTVARVDLVQDLAVLTCADSCLAAAAGPLTPTDQMARGEKVTVTGSAVADDPGHHYRFLDAQGEWAGGATRDDAVPLGRMTSSAVVPGMSGAPVVRDRDGAVAGVVSGRYNSVDGWLADAAWVARTEDLAALLDGVAEVTMAQAPLAGPVDLVLTVAGETVRLTGPGIDLCAAHGGVRPGLAAAVNEVRRARAGMGLSVQSQAETQVTAGALSLGRAGRLLGESFLPEPMAAELGKVLESAERVYQPVRIGVEVIQALAGLPWEALPGPAGQPLVMHPLVSMYRKVGIEAARVVPGPLQIVVAIASPDTGGGPLLDYEQELRNVLAEVRSARQDAADVQVVPFATPTAIRDELDHRLVHVLHVSGHGSPGKLDLENEDGTALPLTAEDFFHKAIPRGKMPPLITLSACYTDAAAAKGGASFAARLCQDGASAVIATETSVTDIYTTRLLARVYATLARARHPDAVAALADARREVQTELETSTDRRDNELAGLAEWAAVTILSASGSAPVLDPDTTAASRPSRPRITGLPGRGDWYFVGRRAEQRSWPGELTGSALAGIVVYGIGGIGKTALASELTARVQANEPSRVLVSLTGSLTLEGLLATVISSVRRELLTRGEDGEALRALDVAAQTDLGWQDRWAVLRARVLDHVPTLMVLDNFEDNLRPAGSAGYAVGDELLAGLLADWAADPGAGRLLITSRHPFTLPGGAEQHLSFRQLGPLSRAETRHLALSLPALDRLDEAQLEQAWRLAGGHPRSLEYLDALLSGGTARYPDVTTRLSEAVGRRLGGADREQWLGARTELDAALAETVALAADDVLLGDLLAHLSQVPGAVQLLVGMSVYREPVDINAVLFQVGQRDQATGGLPRWTPGQRVWEILAPWEITVVDDSFDPESAPEQVPARLGPHIPELNQAPVPPFQPPPDLAQRISACQAASLLTVSGAGHGQRFFVHRWTATELAERAIPADSGRLEQAHWQATAYWWWRVVMWPQDRGAKVHDLLQARYHLVRAGDADAVDQVTQRMCSDLDTMGEWDLEASLIHDTLDRLPADSPRQAGWFDQLGVLAQKHGDYSEAARQYQRAFAIKKRLGDQTGMATTYHLLGNVALLRRQFGEAARQYQRALDTFKRLDYQAGMAGTYAQLGHLARARGDYDQAARRYQHAVDIFERLDYQGETAGGYHNLGMVAEARGDYGEAARQYQRAVDIFERLGDQAGTASTYHQLGVLAQNRGNYDEATRQYQRSLDIFERLGDQVGIAANYHDLGSVAFLHEDYDEAARQYQRALAINERVGDQVGMAKTYHQLGLVARACGDYEEATRHCQHALTISEGLGDEAGVANAYDLFGVLAQDRADFGEAARQYQHALDIFKRLGVEADIALTYSQLGIVEAERGGPQAAVIAWHVKALAIRLRLDIPQAVIDLRRLAEVRRELGPERFTSLLAETTTAANARDTTAMVGLGVLLADRLDPPDLGRALTWLQKATEAGDTDAMVGLGALLAERLDPPDLTEARTWYQKAANAGNTDAMINLGNLLGGRLDPPDLDGARAWFQKAADAGDTRAFFNLGVLLDYRLDPPDLTEARAWYQKAADAGNTDAMYNLGVLLADRLDPPDVDEARTWYAKAADAGHGGSTFNLGNLLAYRLDPPDLPGARTWYTKAADAGDTRAMNNLGVLLAGQLDPPDVDGARTWYTKAADAGHTDAMVNLGVLLAGQLDPPDVDGARTWYTKAADAGNPTAMVGLGNLLAYLLDPPDLSGARGWFQKAADAGDTRAMVNLGVLLAGQLDPPDVDGARTWYTKAADAGDTRAMVNLGNLLVGQLDPPDLGGARGWLQKAADAGDTTAMVGLGLLLAERLDPPDLDEARGWLQKAADAGDTSAAHYMSAISAAQSDADRPQRRRRRVIEKLKRIM